MTLQMYSIRPSSCKAMPYINRYVTYLQRGCGLSLNIDKETWKSIDAIRDIRNRYVHKISRDLPDQIQRTLQELFESDHGAEFKVNDEFVRTAFEVIGSLATKLDVAYWTFVESREIQATEGA